MFRRTRNFYRINARCRAPHISRLLIRTCLRGPFVGQLKSLGASGLAHRQLPSLVQVADNLVFRHLRIWQLVGLEGIRWIHMKVRETISIVLLAISGTLCLVASVLSTMALSYGYDPHSRNMLLALYWGRGLFIFPCFLIGVLRSKWSVLPLWILCLILATLPFVIPSNMRFALGIRNVPFGMRELKEAASVMLLPLLAQLARWLRLPN